MEMTTTKPEPPDPPEENRCKVIRSRRWNNQERAPSTTEKVADGALVLIYSHFFNATKFLL